MSPQDTVKINLNIGGQTISLNVPFSRQDFARDVEKSADTLYTRWRRAFPKKSDREVLTMVAYQFASHYEEIKALYEEASGQAERMLSLFDEEDDAGGGV